MFNNKGESKMSKKEYDANDHLALLSELNVLLTIRNETQEKIKYSLDEHTKNNNPHNKSFDMDMG